MEMARSEVQYLPPKLELNTEELMSIITISRGSYSRGKEIAEKVAAKLGYQCISRDLLLEVSKDYNIPEIKLVHAIHDAPGILGRMRHKDEKYIAYIKHAFLNRLKADNIVYHGLAGHFFVKDVPHALKVRILSDKDDRVQLEMERKNIDAKEARHTLEKDDLERQKWSQSLYGIDTRDPSLYDLILHIKHLTVDDATDIICNCVGKEQFQTTPASQRIIEDLALSAALQKALIDVAPDISVCVDDHIAHIEMKAPIHAEGQLVYEIREVTASFEEISKSEIVCHPIVALSE
jgi:cytidylate kinase